MKTPDKGITVWTISFHNAILTHFQYNAKHIKPLDDAFIFKDFRKQNQTFAHKKTISGWSAIKVNFYGMDALN